MASAFFPLSRGLPQVVFFLVSAYFENHYFCYLTLLRKKTTTTTTKQTKHTYTLRVKFHIAVGLLRPLNNIHTVNVFLEISGLWKDANKNTVGARLTFIFMRCFRLRSSLYRDFNKCHLSLHWVREQSAENDKKDFS